MGTGRVLQGAPCLGELRIDPLTTPGRVGAPAEAFGKQEISHPTALEGDGFLCIPICRKSIEGPRGAWQRQWLRRGQRGRTHFSDLVGRVGRRAPCAGLVGEACQTSGLEALAPRAHGDRWQLELLGNRWHAVPLGGQQDDPSAFDQPGGGGT